MKLPRAMPAVAGLVLCVLGLLVAPASADPLDAAVLIGQDVPQGRVLGTGVAISEDATHWYILTNAHVAGRQVGATVQCVFYRQGYSSRGVQGRVVWAAYNDARNLDAAVISVAKSALANLGPSLADASRDAIPNVGDTITSAGHPDGSWANQFRGHVVAVTGNVIRFVPRPKGGRSGSGLYDEAGRLVGLVTWSDQQAGEGLAQTWASLRAAIGGGQPADIGKFSASTAWCSAVTLPCVVEGEGPLEIQCPGPYCPSPPSQKQPPYGSRPYGNQPYGSQPSPPEATPGDPWPGLPPSRRVPDPDAGQGKEARRRPFRDKLDPERDKARDRRGEDQAPPSPPVSPPKDSRQAPPPVERPPIEPGPTAGLRPSADELKRAIADAASEAAEKAKQALQPAIEDAKKAAQDVANNATAQATKAAGDIASDAAQKAKEAITPAVEEIRKTGERVDRLGQQWQRTNDSIQSVDGKVWPALIVLVVAVLVRVLLPTLLAKTFGVDQSQQMMQMMQKILKRLGPSAPPPSDRQGT